MLGRIFNSNNRTGAAQEYTWWQQAVFYQIYPRSFMDSNGDGIGDLDGITLCLDYLVELGIDAIWISPFYKSPMADFGYDVSGHTDIDPIFGDMAAFDRLLNEAHKRNLRVVLDYVPNHTSDQHPWFIESRASRDNPKRDWYIWRDGKPDGNEPNNWESFFGGSAWEWDVMTGQYYLHLFVKEQPDLNWRNPEVVKAMRSVLRFWLDKGVDGFRVDVPMCLLKHPAFPDNPPVEPGSRSAAIGMTQEPVYYRGRSENHRLFREFREILDSYADRVLVGETVIYDPVDLATYYGEHLDEFHLPFNFITLYLPWRAQVMKEAISAYFAAIPQGATPNFVFGNHDVHRLATRYGPHNLRSVGMFLLTLWGIPTIYYGDELGMEDVHIPPERIQDPWGINKPNIDVGRDPERTPMQWDASPNAGFCPADVMPWLPVADDYRQVNVEIQQADPASTLNYYKQLLKLRRELPALLTGDFAFLEDMPTDILAYTRNSGEQRVLVVFNFGRNSTNLDLSTQGGSGEILLSSKFTPQRKVNLSALPLNAYESMLINIESGC